MPDTYTLIITDKDGQEVTYEDVQLEAEPRAGESILPKASAAETWKPFVVESVEGNVIRGRASSNLGA